MSIFDKLFGGHHGGGQGYGGGHGRGGPPAGGWGNSGVACPNCKALNAPGARFCQQCGTSLALSACTQCGTKLQPGVKFCSQCGKAGG
ncbi:MAG: zinc-ribbon domain-containing protein [Burkholderiales bacterium]|nr:zinc-ribbon domain-containing protein [Burkholderiales bacterium]